MSDLICSSLSRIGFNRSACQKVLWGVPAEGAVGCADSVGGADQRQDAGPPITPTKWYDGGVGGVNGIPEICGNGVDDNLDGITDRQQCYVPESCDVMEGGRTREYYTGPNETLNIGICKPGTEQCLVEPDSERAYWIRTSPDVTPFDEVCDSDDNNCNGATDEDGVCGKPDAGVADLGVADVRTPPDAGVSDIRVAPDAATILPDAAIPVPDAGIPDEGAPDSGTVCIPTEIGTDIRISDSFVQARHSSLVWTGSEYGVSWDDSRGSGGADIYFTRIDSAGNEIGEDRVIADGVHSSSQPSLVWTGSEYGVSWSDGRLAAAGESWEIYFTRIDSIGNEIGIDSRISNGLGVSQYSSLVWTGSEYGVSWDDERDGNWEIYFARIDSAGNKIGEDVRITDNSALSWHLSLAWTGSEYGVSWYDERYGDFAIYFARIDDSGNKIGEDIQITDPFVQAAYPPSLVWTGSEYGASWNDMMDGSSGLSFARIDNNGNVITYTRITERTPSAFFYPSLVWTGSEYGVSWHASITRNSEIYFARIDSSGREIGEEIRITDDPANSLLPSLVWTGSEYGVSWDDERDGNWEIYFTRIGVCE